MTGRGSWVAAIAACALLTAAPSALAAPDCPGARAPVTLLSGAGLLETVAFDGDGRMWLGELGQGRTMRLDGPGEQPQVVLKDGGSGHARGPGGTLTIGTLDPLLPPETGLVGLEVEPALAGAITAAGLEGRSRLELLHPGTGRVELVADGLSIVNGVAYSKHEGAYYVSNHEAGWIQRVAPDGSVDPRWLALPSANGLAIDPSGRWLYAVQTFGAPTRVSRIDLSDPSRVETVAQADLESEPAGLDGLRFGPGGRLYAAAHGSGQVWRIEPGGSICVLARGIDPGLDGPADVAVGPGTAAFPATSLYVTTFSGKLLELPDAVLAP